MSKKIFFLLKGDNRNDILVYFEIFPQRIAQCKAR